MTLVISPAKPLTALDLCFQCNVRAYVRVRLASGTELVMCTHHGLEHAVALDGQGATFDDQTDRISEHNGVKVVLAKLAKHAREAVRP